MEHDETYDGSTPTDCPCDKCGKLRALFLLAACSAEGEGRNRLVQELIADRERLARRLDRVKSRVMKYV